MDTVTYILDSTVIADRFRQHPQVIQRLTHAGEAGHILGLCDPVRYEVLRGLLKVNATNKLQLFQEKIAPLFDYLPLTDADWERAAELWAQMRNQGKQLSDADLLIASLAQRLNAVIVTSDADFAALPISREDWRDVQ
ncbi:MAG: type II toxin-antitoxin system VapC family toxin [Chloroflexi bacterium]|nr:type II toxin-antitoxin system VapC family toxin [Chloroflexota bacterium]